MILFELEQVLDERDDHFRDPKKAEFRQGVKPEGRS